MKVLVVSRSLPPDVGGYQRQLSMLLPLLVARGVHVEAVGAARIRPGERSPGWPEVSTTVVPGWRLPRPVRGIADLIVVGAAMRRGRRHRREHPALLLASPTMIGASLLTAWWSRRLGRVVLRFPGAGDARRLAARWPMRLARSTALRSIALSPQLYREVETAGLGETHLVPNAVEPPPAAPETPSPRFLFIGRLIATKGLDVLLDAWEAIEGEVEGWELHIIGSGRGEHADVEAAVTQRADALHRVRMLGAVSDARVHLVPPAVLVHPSTREGLPNAVLEAMAAGVPVVAATQAVANWFAEPPSVIRWDGVSAASLAATMAAAARSPESCAEVASAARSFVSAHHAPDAVAGRYAEVLSS